MPNIHHDATFAMRVAKAKKLVRYNSTVCPKCSAIIPIEERDRHVASCRAKIPPSVPSRKKRRNSDEPVVQAPSLPFRRVLQRSPVVLIAPPGPVKLGTPPRAAASPAALSPCPHCGAQVRGTRLAKHIAVRCAKAPAEIVAARQRSVLVATNGKLASAGNKRKRGGAGKLGRWSNHERDAQVVAYARAAREARESMSD